MLRSTKWLSIHELDKDFYIMLVRFMIDSGYFDYGEVWIQDASHEDAILFSVGKFKVRRFKSIISKSIEFYPDVLYVRGGGGGGDYSNIINQCSRSIKLYWSGNKYNIPEKDIYDVVFVTNESVAPNIKSGVIKRLLKGAVESVFHPIENVQKIYDICYVANITRPVKNHELLIKSLKDISTRLNVVMVGDDLPVNIQEYGYVTQISTLAKSVDHSITFTGRKNKTGVNLIMNQSKFGVICSEEEDSPRVLAEYLAAGIPVLCNKNLIDHNFYINDDTGIAKFPEDFNTGICEMLERYCDFNPYKYFYKNLRISVIAEDIMKTIDGLKYESIRS